MPDELTIEQREALVENLETVETMRRIWSRHRPSDRGDTRYTREARSAYETVGRCIDLIRFDLQPADRIDLARGMSGCSELRRQIDRLLFETASQCLHLTETRLQMHFIADMSKDIAEALQSVDDAIAAEPAEIA